MKKLKIYVLIGALVSVSACAKTIGLTYYTSLDGAVISDPLDNRQMGYSPVRIEYKWDKRFVANGCMRLRGLRAVWASGVSAQAPDIVTVCNGPGEYNYTLIRPDNEEGMQQDIEFALKVRQMRERRQQAALQAQLNANAFLLGMMNAATQAALSRPKTTPRRSNTRCVTTFIGDQAYTNCY